MALMGEYPTPEGKLLSGFVWNHMVDNFGTGKSNDDYSDPIIKCISSSSNNFIRPRVENYKSYIAVRDGLKEYMTQYSTIELITTGTVVGTTSKQQVNIVDTDEVILYGYIGFNSDALYNVYSIPNIFNTCSVDLGVDSYLKSIEKFFDIIVAWLSFPMVDIKSSGMGNGIYVTGNGHIQFGQNADITSDDKKDEIFAEYKKKLDIVMKQSQEYFAEHGEPMKDIFSLVWDIIASGIVDYINTNEIISEDTGTGVLSYNDDSSNAPMTENAVYTGMSEGICIFTDYMVPKIVLELPPIPPVGSLTFNINIPDVPTLECPTVTIIDEYGVEKEIKACPVLPPIFATIFNIATVVKDAVEQAIAGVVEFVKNILERLGYAIEYILKIISDLIEALTLLMAKVIKAIMDGFNKFLEFISTQIVIPVVKSARAVVWAVVLNLQPYGIILKVYYVLKTLMNFIKAIIQFISKVIGKVIELIGKLVKLIQYVIESVGKLITEIVTWVDEHINIDDDFDDDTCNVFKVALVLISNIISPVVPDDAMCLNPDYDPNDPDSPQCVLCSTRTDYEPCLPTEPDVPDIPDDAMCLNPDYDPNDPNSPQCVVCSTCPDCEPCPPTDDDGNDISDKIPAKVPSDIVEDTDPLYAVSMGIVTTALQI